MTTAKPAGEPRPRWTLFRNEHAGGYDVLDREMMFAHVPTLPEAERIVAALNAAETRAAKPAGEPRPRWSVGSDNFDVYRDRKLFASCATQANAAEIVAALNAAETRAAQPQWACKANRTADPPLDCDWPTCGCDPYADKVIEALEESGILPAAQPGDAPKLTGEYPWSLETMALINKLTPDIKGKAFDPDWFLLRNRLEQFEANALLASHSTPADPTDKETEMHKLPHEVDGIPRRCRIDLATPAEKAIRRAREWVEGMPADVRLTEASILIGTALDKVADFLEGRTSSAPAPASTEAPREPSTAKEVLQAAAGLLDDYWLHDRKGNLIATKGNLRVAILGLESKFTLAAPGTEALIAAGDARERPICKWCVEDASPPEWSAHAKVWIHRRERLDKQCLNPPTALAERLRESTWWRRLTFHHQESYFAIEGDKRIASLRAALAELERPRDVPSV